MVLYVTYNDAPTGIFTGQVIDVIKFARSELKVSIKLVAFISIRGFLKNRKKIKNNLPDALVVPMWPGVGNWKNNYWFLQLINVYYRPRMIIGRSVLATNLALTSRDRTCKVVYDGRGAIAAEWHEYPVGNDKKLIAQISDLEKIAVRDSDTRIAVSEQLVTHWKKEFKYEGKQHEVIPCTLSGHFLKLNLTSNFITGARQMLGYSPEDLVFVYSGSVAGWQSFDQLRDFMVRKLSSTLNNHQFLILSENSVEMASLIQRFPGKIQVKHVSPTEVPVFLAAADFGLLIREKSITNQVASPVKFAEYLACGLKVIISEAVGDYSSFVIKHAAGSIIGKDDPEPVTFIEKQRLRNLALLHFSKQTFKNSYARLFTAYN